MITRRIKWIVILGCMVLLTFTNGILAKDEMKAMPEAVESGMAPVNDIEVYYAVYGEGDPLLLLHGGLGNSEYWGNVIEAFMEEYMVIVMDSRGHGRSTMSEQPISYSLMASDVLALLDYLELESASIVGWSDGGIIGLDIAINNPDRLDTLIAYGANYTTAGVRSDVEENARFGEYVELAVGDYLEMSPNPDLLDAFVENISNMWATEPNFSAEQLGGVTAPVLILDGWGEEAIVTAHTVEMASLIPTAELTLMAGTGHFAMWQQPERFSTIVLSFLETAD